MVDVKCDYCGKTFKKKKSYIKKHNFCSRKCYGEFRKIYYVGEKVHNSKPRNTYYCANCNKEIQMLESTARYKKNIFCSKQCRFEYDSKVYKGVGNPNYKKGNIKINCLNCGKEFERPAYQENRAKYCSKKCKDEYWSKVLSKTKEHRERLILQGIKAKKTQKNKFTKPEKIVYDYLNKNGIECIPQYPMYNMFVVDFFIPSLNIVIEVLGDYWHGNPSKYSFAELSETQLKHQKKDKIKKDFLLSKGHNVYMIWENDIYKNLDETMNFLSNY